MSEVRGHQAEGGSTGQDEIDGVWRAALKVACRRLRENLIGYPGALLKDSLRDEIIGVIDAVDCGDIEAAGDIFDSVEALQKAKLAQPADFIFDKLLTCMEALLDAWDTACADTLHETQELFDGIIRKLPASTPKADPWQVYYGDSDDEPRTPLVEGFLYSETLVVEYGKSGDGKTLVALDLALAVASGRPWRSMPARRRTVVYVALEGANGIRGRVEAWRALHPDVMDADFAMFPLRTKLNSDGGIEQLREGVERARRRFGRGVGLIVIDTLHKALAGDDDASNAVIGGFYSRLAEFQHAGACVVVIHHTSRSDTKNPRGAGAITADADTVLSVQRGVIVVEKQRDGEAGAVYPFRLIPAGDSLAVEHLDRAPAAKVRKAGKAPLADPQTALLATVARAAADGSPFTMTGKRGLFARRTELPAPCNGWSRAKLAAAAAAAKSAGRLAADSGGCLTVTN